MANRRYLDVLFDGFPGPDSCKFIDVVDENGHGVNAGEWLKRGNGTVALRITVDGSADYECEIEDCP